MLASKTFLFNFMCSMFSSLCNNNNFRQPGIRNDGRNDPNIESDDRNPIIYTKSGPVMGYLQLTSEGKIIRAWESIPYAMAPINQLRFQKPVPVKPWRNVKKATKPPPMCLQVNPTQLFRTVGEEDCLYLSIYSPISDAEKNISRLNKSGKGQNVKRRLLPVVVFIHGGGFSFGYSGDYGPYYLLNKDVVLVTLNYRVGILGFLSTGTESCPGNNGLKDQSLAIKWIFDNIEAFGGDKANLNVMGQSAGAVSTHLHMLSKQSQSYMKTAASFSGSAFEHWSVQTPEKATRLRNKMANLIGCPTHDADEQLQCFKQQNPVFLVANQLNLIDWLPFPPILFAPVIEIPSNSSFLSETPEQLYKKNQVAKIPWITSITSQEGYIFLLFLKGLLRLQSFRQNWESLQPLALDYKYFATKFPVETTEKIKSFYFGNLTPTQVPLNQLSDVLSDRYFTFGFIKGLEAHSKVAPTYGYIWKYKGKYNIANAIGIPSSKWGVGHGEDLFYMFNSSSSYSTFSQGESEYKLSKIVLNMLNNFFYTREPLYDMENGKKVKVWDPIVNSSSLQLLQIDHDIQMIPNPYEDRIKFWLSLNLSDTQPFVP